ncbi:MAG: alpha/beta hydrolase-fold protein [Bryobacteraceae bacterium]
MKFLAGLIAGVMVMRAASPPTSAEREQISSRLAQLTRMIDELRSKHVDDARIADIEIYQKAAIWILRFEEEFFTPEYASNALKVLDHGLARAANTAFSWESAKGRIVRGYRSKIDGSVQPYGLVIPESYDGSKPVRLDVVLHGRGEQLTEVSFIAAHESDKAIAQDYITLDVYGRGNNGYRWAGETDVFEAIDSVKARYNIDEKKIVLRGFSMGGAGAWHIGLHYPDKWAAVEAGAGFTETKTYAKLGPLVAYQEAMLRIYDAVEYAANARMVPIVGYGGEIDPQLQASVNIRERLAAEHIEPPHILFLVGPGTAHKWEPQSLEESNTFIDAMLSRPVKEPDHIHFVTYTTAFHKCYWISIESLEKEYQRAEVEAIRAGSEYRVATRNVSRIAIEGSGHAIIDGQSIELANFGLLVKTSEGWRRAGKAGRYKKTGLQGPVDDAFKDAFLVVRPTGKPENKDAGQYVNETMDQFRKEWAKYMRGEVRIKDDKAVTDDDIDRYHLILFGDMQSNKLTKRLAPQLMRSWPAAPLVPVLIAPNPLNPARYVVFNSGHTFHADEFKGSNALLYPRLGDYAVIHPTLRTVTRGGLFDTEWRQLLRPLSSKP